jgi:hypothetical protein
MKKYSGERGSSNEGRGKDRCRNGEALSVGKIKVASRGDVKLLINYLFA